VQTAILQLLLDALGVVRLERVQQLLVHSLPAFSE
jgi:hypothetical protein